MSNLANPYLLELQMTGEEKTLTGQLLFRDGPKGKQAGVPEGKKLMLVAGIVMVPDDFEISGETFVHVHGYNPAKEGTVVFVNPHSAVPVGMEYAGWKVDDLLTQPIWKIPR